jgi:hypothetical protein
MKVLKFAVVADPGQPKTGGGLLAAFPMAVSDNENNVADWAEYCELEKQALMRDLQRQMKSVFAARSRTIKACLGVKEHGKPKLSVIKGGRV